MSQILQGAGHGSRVRRFLFDQFTDTSNVALPSHSPIIGGTWTTGRGDWSIGTSGNEVASTGELGTNNVTLSGGQPNGNLSCDIFTGDTFTYAGLAVRRTSSNTFVAFFLRNGEDDVQIGFYNAGAFTALTTSAFTVSTGTTYAIRLRLDGTTIEAFVGGSTVASAATTFNQTASAHGLLTFDAQANVRWDNFIQDP